MKRKVLGNVITCIVLVLAVIGVAVFLICYDESDTVDIIAADKSSLETGSYGEETTLTMAVHIVGCVEKPGVYYVDEGAIVNDVVKLAGGLTKDADVSVTNLARRVTDGMMITIYSKRQVAEGNTALEAGKQVQININTADKERLMSLPGIGESKATAIISYRNKNGGFKEIKEIMNISGIKEAVFNKIKDYITV